MLLTKNKRLRQFLGVIETGNLLSLKLLLKKPAEYSRYPGMMFRDYMALSGGGQWSTKDIHEIFPEFADLRVTIEHLPGRGIINPIDELVYMAIITKGLNPQNIFEIGTYRGRTALNFALNSPDNCRVYTMDLPPENKADHAMPTNSADARLIDWSQPGAEFLGKDVAGKITQIYGNSLEYDFSEYSGKMDIIFIDGAHHYEAVISDTNNALQMIRPGGVILWHDFANYGDYNDVTRAIRDTVGAENIVQIERTQLALYRAPASE